MLVVLTCNIIYYDITLYNIILYDEEISGSLPGDLRREAVI